MKIKFFLLLAFFLTVTSADAQSGTQFRYGKSARHIGRITKDSIIVIKGSTYSFTVDTPEDQGLFETTATARELTKELTTGNYSEQVIKVIGRDGKTKSDERIEEGDQVKVISKNGKDERSYRIGLEAMAHPGQLDILPSTITARAAQDLVILFTAGQRSPNTTVRFFFPPGFHLTDENTTVNVIGRGDVKLKDLASQSMGRTGSNYKYKKVGNFSISENREGSVLLFKHLDLRPANGVDLELKISGIKLNAGKFPIRVQYETSEPEVLKSQGTGSELVSLNVTNTISDFDRVINRPIQYSESTSTYTSVEFQWGSNLPGVKIMLSLDQGKTWKYASASINRQKQKARISNLMPNRLYSFRMLVPDGLHKGFSNIVKFYSGKMDVKKFRITGEGVDDDTEKINAAISFLNEMGGGTLFFSPGIYQVRTVHLQSNVWLYVDKGATIKALKGGDAPESTWFSDKKYRSGLSPTDSGPYQNPENWLTKQDVGHHYFRNALFFGERLDNVKIIGNGYITGNGNLVTGDRVMNNSADNRSDKMFSLKLCTNIEIGGLHSKKDLWYDEEKDVPCYLNANGSRNYNVDNMLHIDRGGHFVLLATGTDQIYVHDTYFAKQHAGNARDIYDFMQCNDVTVTNIYSRVSSDDIVKPGSDCSLGFTRPAKKYMVRNIIGDTNCNLFQIGSETADDIMDVHVDNIYVLGANKAGFSISTNDGAHIKDIHLNCGHTGKLHSRSKMLRTTTPFFISISNRGRVLGADVERFKFEDNGVKHDELLVTNINIGVVENIILNGVDVTEVYSGSSFGEPEKRWKPYDSKSRKATPIVAGYALPDSASVEGGLRIKLPNGKHTGYIQNIEFTDIHVLVKGGNPLSDTAAAPPELGVGQYNVSNLKTQPAYGLWARHVKGLVIKNSQFNYETTDNRYVIFLDDVTGARISNVTMVKPPDVHAVLKLKNSSDVQIDQSIYYQEQWGKLPVKINHEY